MECPHRQLGLSKGLHQLDSSAKVLARIRPTRSCCGARPSLWGQAKSSSLSRPSRRSPSARSALLGDGEPGDKADRKKAVMLKYVAECAPTDVQQFIESAPQPVVAAMRQTVTNIIGSLPSAYFEVKVSTVADSLAQLFLTMARTGYLFASAQCRMELQAALNSSSSIGSSDGSDTGSEADQASPLPSLASLPSTSSSSSATSTSTSTSTSSSNSNDVNGLISRSLIRRDSGSDSVTGGRATILLPGEEQYAPGVQKRNLEGEVLRWSYENGLERVEAAKYVEHLEEQVATLKDMLLQVHEAHQQHQNKTTGRQEMPTASSGRAGGPSAIMSSLPGAATAAAAAAAAAATGSGELLEFLRGLHGDSLGELTSNMGPEVLDAMDAFVARLMGTTDKEQLRSMSSEFNAAELSKVLLWLLVVGYALRTAEMRLDTMSGGHGQARDKGFAGLFGVKGKSPSKGLWGGAFGGWGKLLPGN